MVSLPLVSLQNVKIILVCKMRLNLLLHRVNVQIKRHDACWSLFERLVPGQFLLLKYLALSYILSVGNTFYHKG